MQILPQRLEFAATVTAPGDVPPQTFLDFAQSGMMEPLGKYQGVFLARLLGPRGKRPGCARIGRGRAAEQRDDIVTPHHPN
jgi:hypothetical protein